MRAPNNALAADVRFICGSMGTGKSHGTKESLKGESNVYVFDVKNEYGSLKGFRVVHSREDFVRAIKAGGRWAWPKTSPEDFEFFCRAVWARGCCLAVVEELASLTGTAKARGAWHLILTQGRGYGIRVVGLAQRPAEVDKTIIGNATLLRVHRLSRADDRAYMAKELDVPQEAVDALSGYQFIQRDVLKGQVSGTGWKGQNSAQKTARKPRKSL